MKDSLLKAGGGLLCALAALVVVSACSQSANTAAPAATGGMQAGSPSGMDSGMGAGNRSTTVLTALVASSEFTDATEALGTAKSNEAVDVTAKSTNRVVAIHFREGEFVKQGAVLVELDGVEAHANLAQAEASLRDTQSQYQRSRELYQTKVLSESDLIQLEAKMLTSKAQVDAAQSRVSDTVIRAPFGGRIGLRNVSVGSLVTPGQIMTTLDDTSIIKLDFTVPETYIATLKEGQTVMASSAAYNGAEFRGRIGSIATRVDPVSRSVVVRALIDNREQRLKPGMFMTVQVARSQGQVLLVPEQALIPEANQQFVYVVSEQRAHKQKVIIGRRKPGQVEVQQGLQAGDVIVVEGGEKLSEGAQVNAATAVQTAVSPASTAQSAIR